MRHLINIIDTKLVIYFGNYCEVRSLEFFLAWGKATEHPFFGNICKKLFDWFCKYYSGFVVPQDGALAKGTVIMPYENILELIKRAEIARLIPCSCKSFRNPKDNSMPRDTCMVFSEPGYAALDEIANKKNTDENWVPSEKILKKLRECEEYGLVHQIMCLSNPLGRKMYVLCNCDGYSCIPNYIKLRYNVPFVRSSGFMCKVEKPEKCSKCNKCIEKCFYKAGLFDSNGIPVVDKDKCMGCGLCLSSCEAGIRSMYREPKEEFHRITNGHINKKSKLRMVIKGKNEYPEETE